METQETGKPGRRLVYIECGITARSNTNTGIQRVVRNITQQAIDDGANPDFEFISVMFKRAWYRQYHGTMIRTAGGGGGRPSLSQRTKKFLKDIGIAEPIKTVLKKCFRVRARIGRRLEGDSGTTFGLRTHGGDGRPAILLLLDSTWLNTIWESIDSFRAQGGQVVAVLYDMIPFTHPETVEEHTREFHTSWWKLAPAHVDSVICISKAVRDEFLAWQRASCPDARVPDERVGFFYLGAELNMADPIIRVTSSASPVFMAIGSLEPRKNHAIILDAFDRLWADGVEATLLIVGSSGWKSEEMIGRINRHPQLDRQLFVVRNVSDRELTMLYRQVTAVIMASVAEGFGLPIVEARRFGTPVICSDIPVFREVAGDKGAYFPLGDPLALAGCITRELTDKRRDNTDGGYSCQSWHESYRQVIANLPS